MELVKCLTKGQIDCTASLCWISAASQCCCQVYLHFWLIFLIQKLMQKVFSNEKHVCQYSPLPLWISAVLLLWVLAPDLFISWFAWKPKSSFSKCVVSFSRSFWEQKAALCYQTCTVFLYSEREEKQPVVSSKSLFLVRHEFPDKRIYFFFALWHEVRF